MTEQEAIRRRMRRAAKALADSRGIGYAAALFLVRRAEVVKVLRGCHAGETVSYQEIADASGVAPGKVREICAHLKRKQREAREGGKL